MSSWYVVHTKRAGESTVETQLIRQGYEVYMPRLIHTVRQRGRWRERIVPLFPRYLFFRLHEGRQSLGPVRSTLGVSNVVRFGQRYATVPDQLIRVLQARADSATGLHCMLPPPPPARGSSIKIAAGPFDGLEGVFERECGADRVVVLLNLLGKNTRVHLPIDALLPWASAST